MKSFFKRITSALGPGLITGASDDDPSGIATYAQTGALFGYAQLWMAPYTFPFMTGIQEICGRIGLVTGKGVARIAREHYAKPVLVLVVGSLLVVNTINVGADLGAMASSAELLFGIPFAAWLLIFTGITLMLQIVVPYPIYARYLKYLSLALLAYVIAAFAVAQPWGEIALHTIVPTIVWSKTYLMNVVAVLGTTISAYLFFWEADLEAEEDYAHHRIRFYGKGVPKITKKDVQNLRIDTVVGMGMSNLVTWFIFITAASTLHLHGVFNVQTATQAAEALRPLAGNFTYWLFAAGIIGTGLQAVPILAGSASYALSETLNWSAGLHYSFGRARAFYAIIIASTVLGALINFAGVAPFTMLYYTAVLNGLIAPPAMVMVMIIANNKKIMGTHVNGRWSNVLGWGITIIMSLCALALLFTVGW